MSDLFPIGSDTIDDEFTLGETVNIELTYDPDTPEDASTVGRPNQAFYVDEMASFSFEFVESGRRFDILYGGTQFINVDNDVTGPGFAQDTVGTSVQTQFGGSISGTINGTTPTLVTMSLNDLEFSGLPLMLTDASLPNAPFAPDNAILILSLSPGENITVTVELLPEPATALLLGIAGLAIARLRVRR